MPYMSIHHSTICFLFFFFNDTATTEIYTLSLHDALPICSSAWSAVVLPAPIPPVRPMNGITPRSEEHTSELQSRFDLVCRLLLEKKNPQEGANLDPRQQSDEQHRPHCTVEHLPAAANSAI